MSRILLLLVMIIWMSRSALPGGFDPMRTYQSAALFVGGLALIVLFIGLWSRMLARHFQTVGINRSLRRFHRSIFVARLLIPVWFAVAVLFLGWGHAVDRLLRPINQWPVELPGLLIGTLPAFAAWAALWWAQYPADHALREQNLMFLIEEGLPVHAPPGLWSYFLANLRLQLLFTVVPVLVILFLRDIVRLCMWRWWGVNLLQNPQSSEDFMELLAMVVAINLVVLFMPELLRYVLATEPLPDSPLRERLDALCKRAKLRYRDILLWRTNHSMGNAAVMGVIPQVRYVLLSDVLLETMSDKQIEAVFAHELGHMKHRHMLWYVIFVVTVTLFCYGPGKMVATRIDQFQHPAWLTEDVLTVATSVLVMGGCFMLFGYLSRWFERQADVYAARTMEQQTHVGQQGAATFASALHRVAVVNNIPVAARNFTHGSIAQRTRYLETLSLDPAKTADFDRTMSLVYTGLLVTLFVCGAWVVVSMVA